MKLTVFFLCCIGLFSSCRRSLQKDSRSVRLDTLLYRNIKPTFGHRFIISGDFDGDGEKENLTEKYFSALDNKEINKLYDSVSDYEQLVALTVKKKPYTLLVSNNLLIDTLFVSTQEQQLGLLYLKNEGDLNGDGGDEISYVVDWADWSNLNTYQIMTLQNKQWLQLYSFAIWDWQVADPSETKSDTKMNSGNKELVKKIQPNKIKIIYRDEIAEEDSMIVDLIKKK